MGRRMRRSVSDDERARHGAGHHARWSSLFLATGVAIPDPCLFLRFLAVVARLVICHRRWRLRDPMLVGVG